MMMTLDEVKSYFNSIAGVIEKFTDFVASEIGTTSISVTRNVRHLPKPVFLHSECSHTMISGDDYEQFLMPIDAKWSQAKEYFGIHYCGNDPHRYAKSFAKLPKLDFLDLGWSGYVAHLRKFLPNTFFNIRLSPVELDNMSVENIRDTINKLVTESANPALEMGYIIELCNYEIYPYSDNDHLPNHKDLAKKFNITQSKINSILKDLHYDLINEFIEPPLIIKDCVHQINIHLPYDETL